MEKKKRQLLGETSVTFSPPETPAEEPVAPEPVAPAASPVAPASPVVEPRPLVPPAPVHWTKSPPAHIQVTESLASRALRPQKLLEDREGLSRAYSSPNNVYVRGNVVYVAGTQLNRSAGEAMGDLFSDVKLPFVGVSGSRRFAELQQALASHRTVTTLVGHSLGAAVSLEMAQRRPELATTSYGAPVMDVFAKSSKSVPNRFANYGDPIAMFDTNATPAVNMGNPHAFSNFTKTSATDSSKGYENADGSVTLFE